MLPLGADKIIRVDGTPDILSALELDAVGIPLVPFFDNNAVHPFAHVGLDLVADFETQLLLCLAPSKPLIRPTLSSS